MKAGVKVGPPARPRRARRQAERMARRAMVTPARFAEIAGQLGVTEHVMFDPLGNTRMVQVDPEKFAAAVARFAARPRPLHAVELDEIDDAAEIDDEDDHGLLAGEDAECAECAICCAVKESAIGVRKDWSLDG